MDVETASNRRFAFSRASNAFPPAHDIGGAHRGEHLIDLACIQATWTVSIDQIAMPRTIP